MTTPTPARPRKEPTKVVRLPQSVCDRLIPLLTDIGTDAVLALLSQNPHPQQSPDKANSDPNLLDTLSIVLRRLDALEQKVFQDNSSDTVVTSPPPPDPDSKLSPEDSEEFAAAPVEVNTVDQDTPENPSAPLCGTATPDELPSFPETTRSLADRWGISPSVLTRQRQRYHDRPRGFFEYSLTKEDGLFGWFYDSTEQLFYPIIHFPDS
jgi:hypothetical protein